MSALIVVLGVLASWRLGTGLGGEGGLGQGVGGGWVATPARPTVGDTVWLERFVPAPPGWLVQALKTEPTPGAPLEPIGDPVVLRAAGGSGWIVRYPVVAWAPAVYWAASPAIVRSGPGGHRDSLPRDSAFFRVWSVIPESLATPTPRPLLPPLRVARRNRIPVGLAVLSAGALLIGVVRWRRRPLRDVPVPPPVPLERETSDARWLAAGEPKAVAARVAHHLRMAVYRAIPEAHPALSTAECLAVVERARPDARLRELRDILEQLDRVAFASAHGTDVAALTRMARRVAQEIAR